MSALPALKKYGLHKHGSVNMVIRDVGIIIDSGTDQLDISNRIIAEFGGRPVTNAVDAGIIARCLAEQAFYTKKDYDAEAAYIYAVDKVKMLAAKMPYIYAAQDKEQASKPTERKSSGDPDKKVKAFDIYIQNKSLKNVEICRLIVAEVGITMANANYYVMRFRKDSK